MDSSRTVTYVVVAVSVLTGVLAVCLLSRYSRKELNRIVAEEEARNGIQASSHESDINQSAEQGANSNEDLQRMERSE
jgi:hypothetical protein